MHHKRLWILIMALLWVFAPDLLLTGTLHSLLGWAATFGFWALLIILAFFTYTMDQQNSP